MKTPHNSNPYFSQYQQELLNLAQSNLSCQLLKDQPWQQRYTQLLKLGKAIQEKPEIRQKDNAINGCEAKLWVLSNQDSQQCLYVIDSDSRVIKGLATLLLLQINGLSQSDINNFDASEFLANNGFAKHISPSRNNGLALLMKQLKTGDT